MNSLERQKRQDLAELQAQAEAAIKRAEETYDFAKWQLDSCRQLLATIVAMRAMTTTPPPKEAE